MSRCAGCGQELTSVGCVNGNCAEGMGGTYLNGVKIATASGRSLVAPHRPIIAPTFGCTCATCEALRASAQ